MADAIAEEAQAGRTGTVCACVVNLGCKVNRIESDWMERELHEAGCMLVEEQQADVVLINTCAVTGEAEAKTRKAIRHAAGMERRPLVCVTGCVANLFPEEIAELGERVHVVADKAAAVREALRLLAAGADTGVGVPSVVACGDEGRETDAEGTLNAPLLPSAWHDGSDAPIATGRDTTPDACSVRPMSETVSAGAETVRSESKAPAASAPAVTHGHEGDDAPETRLRRGVKVQDGCDNRCTYCIVWRARGPVRSTPLEQIERQVRAVLADGAGEIVLSGINLGRFRGTAPDGTPILLDGLLRRVVALAGEQAIVRASSIEPPDATREFAEAMAELRGHVCPHLHLPLQSGCDTTLARMGRAYDTAAFAATVTMVRDALPELSLSTDVIAGFPGETDEEFERTLAFCRQMRFSKMHVFRFSARPDTPAATMPNQVDPRVAQARSERLRSLADELRAADATARVGSVEPILVERIAPDGSARGTTASYHRAVVEPADNRPGTVVPGLVRASIESYDPRTRLLHARALGTPYITS